MKLLSAGSGGKAASPSFRPDGERSPWLRDCETGLISLRVKVIPGASKTACAGLRMTGEGKALLVRVAAAPEKGHANDELVTWLAKRLGIPRSSVSIRTGLTARL